MPMTATMKSKAPKRRQMPCKVSLLQGKRRSNLKVKCTHSGPSGMNVSNTPGVKSTTRITKKNSIMHILPKKTVFLKEKARIMRPIEAINADLLCSAQHGTFS